MPHTRDRGCNRSWLFVVPAVVLCMWHAASAEDRAPTPYPAASLTPRSQPGWERFLTAPDPSAPMDEAQGGKTARGTKIQERRKDCFPPESRNVFGDVDMVASGPDGKLEPFDYTDGRGVTEKGRDAIRGQNTWILWGEGN